MSDEPSPRPWRLDDGFECEIVDATGRHVLTATSRYAIPPLGDECEAANAALICAAVNDHDRLRDLVRRLAHVAQDTLDFAEAMSGIVPDNPERAKARSEIKALLREARAAIGEEKK